MFCSGLGLFLVVFGRVLICRGFIVYEQFYAVEVVFHVFTGLKGQKEFDRRIKTKMNKQKKKKRKMIIFFPYTYEGAHMCMANPLHHVPYG